MPNIKLYVDCNYSTVPQRTVKELFLTYSGEIQICYVFSNTCLGWGPGRAFSPQFPLPPARLQLWLTGKCSSSSVHCGPMADLSTCFKFKNTFQLSVRVASVPVVTAQVLKYLSVFTKNTCYASSSIYFSMHLNWLNLVPGEIKFHSLSFSSIV